MKKEDPDLFYKGNKNFKKCTGCKDWKPISEYYKKNGKPLSGKCIDCCREIDRQKALEKKENQGGSFVIPVQPNKYVDEFQKANTFEFMEILGYLFDEATGIWYKPGWKEIVDGKPYFPKLLPVKRRPKTTITNKLVRKILELRNKNISKTEISNLLELSWTTVDRICIRYGKETHKNR